METGSANYVYVEGTPILSGSITTTNGAVGVTYTFQSENNGKHVFHEMDERPWGSYEVLLDDDDCKVKKIVVQPGEHPSYQYHKKRSEVWQIISGYGVVTLDGEDREVFAGSVVHVLRGEKHKIAAFGEVPLVFIEIQTGEYFGEDDIVRLEDKYGRHTGKNTDAE